MENFKPIEIPNELTKDFQAQEMDKEIMESEIRQLEGILSDSNISSADLYTLKAQYASFMGMPKEQFEEELTNPSGYVDYMSATSKEELIDLMKKDLENLRRKNEKNVSLQN